MATGVSEEKAKADLCRAVADGNIRVLVRIAETAREKRGYVLRGANVGVPYPLKPEDFDWEQSRPHQPWRVGPVGPQSYTDPYWSWERQQIDWVELATADIEKIFGTSQSKAKREATDHDEESAAKMVRDLLTKNEHLKKKDAFQSVRTKHPKISQRGFHQRIWPKGRELANLAPTAPRGRKPKSPRSSQ
jgi:hypothetical protein